MKKWLLTITSAVALVALLSVHASAKEITVRGQLAQTVEAGGWLIVARTGGKTDKYLLLNADRFKSESWFRAGAQVEATGEIKDDVMTIYQEGVPFEARTLRQVASKRTIASSKKYKKASQKYRRLRPRSVTAFRRSASPA